MTSVDANGITIEFERDGDGEPLLLMMGLGGQLTDWPPDFVAMLVDAGFSVIRLDNRDAGLSTEITTPQPTTTQMIRLALGGSRARAPYLLSDMAADAVGLLDSLGVERAHVVGESMGAMIAQAMAIRHPDRVCSLSSMMANTGRLRDSRPKMAILKQLMRLSEPTRETAVETGIEFQRLISGPGFDEREAREMGTVSLARSFRPAGVGRQMAALMASPDRTRDLARVAAPTLVVHGLVDPLVPPSGGLATARAIPASTLLMFSDMGHDIPKSRRQQIVDAIAANASRAPGRAASRGGQHGRD